MAGPQIGIDEQSKYVNEVTQGIVQRLPGSWSKAEFTYVAAGGTSSYELGVTMVDDTSTQVHDVPLTSVRALMRLRRGMYREGAGTRFTATFTVHSSLKCETHFDYESEPNFPIGITPASFVEDLKRFPRDEKNIPDWLRMKLQKAQKGPF
ncbi:hypothetical protein ACQEU8_00445 [Streptomyces sp. CA-250714]|uniref:hypothetical protein n=1 Tax=Streptomyces sp. CA-250714 TaxID=3240060 RepID=UPI003D8BB227